MTRLPFAVRSSRALRAVSAVCAASAVVALAAVGLGAGCSSSTPDESAVADATSARPPSQEGDDSGNLGVGPLDDAAVGPTFSTSVRFAHLAPGLGSVDFCWRASATDPFHGPLLGGGPSTTPFDAGLPGDGDSGADGGHAADASSGEDAGPTDASAGDGGDGSTELDAGPSPLVYLSVSTTISLDSSGTLDVIAVEPGTSCAAPLVLAHVSLSATARTTLLLAGGVQGDASGGLAIMALGDEVAAADATRASVRVVNAALVPAVGSFAAVLEQASYDVPLASVVAPGSASSPSVKDAGTPGVDALGYTSVNPTVSAPSFRIVFAGADGGASPTWASEALAEALYADEVTTAFVGHDDQGYLVLWCSDAVGTSAPSWFVSR